MIYGYARENPESQIESNNIEKQIIKLLACGCDEVIEEQFTGKITDRPRLNELICKLQSGDTLMITKLDRLARDLTQAYKLINELRSREITINILNMGIIDNTNLGVSILNIFSALAEFERDVLIERTQYGKAVASKGKGYKNGRKPKYTDEQRQHALSLLSSNGGDKSYPQVSEATGISVSTLVREMRKDRKRHMK